MRPVALSDEIAVGEMPSADEITILARAGFRSVLNVQPDGEVERLLSASDMAKGVAAGSMNYAHVPIASRRVPDEQVAAFAHAMVTLPRPIYACCYSGARAAAAWALAVAPAMLPADITSACAGAGFDMTALLSELTRRHAEPASVHAEAASAEIKPSPAPTAADTPTPTVSARPVPGDAAPNVAPKGTATAAAAVDAAEKIIFPRAAGAGGFAVSG